MQFTKRDGLFSGSFVRYIMAVYNSSVTTIEMQGSRKEVRPTRGVRQGDPLSPFIFNLVMDGLLETLDMEPNIGYRIGGERVATLAFADDLIFLASSAPRVTKPVGQDGRISSADWSEGKPREVLLVVHGLVQGQNQGRQPPEIQGRGDGGESAQGHRHVEVPWDPHGFQRTDTSLDG